MDLTTILLIAVVSSMANGIPAYYVWRMTRERDPHARSRAR